jgi:RNA polymerase sigma-70 factor (ECF subfamily)
MDDAETFQSLIAKVRGGDQAAAAELVRRYEPMVRRAARVRLSDARLGRFLDSMDICQSVMASFFVRAALGQYELDTPDQLLKLLATMARNKLASQAQGQRAKRRDVRRVDPGGLDRGDLAGRDATPSRQIAARELLDAALQRLGPEELRVIERRQEGQDWATIAAAEGVGPEALRKRLSRAVNRVAQEIGLDESDAG